MQIIPEWLVLHCVKQFDRIDGELCGGLHNLESIEYKAEAVVIMQSYTKVW